MTEAIIIGLISSGTLSVIISAIIAAINNRRSKLNDIDAKLTVIEANQRIAEKDALRTQLLLMIADYPEERTEILKLAERYFSTLHGNWVAAAIFDKYLKQYCPDVSPAWFQYKGE